jgi:K+ potassium transporter
MTVASPSEVTTPRPVKTSGGGLALTGLAALGIVFGDIGTSPLYTLKTALDFLSGETTPDRCSWHPFLGHLDVVPDHIHQIRRRRHEHRQRWGGWDSVADGASRQEGAPPPRNRRRGSSRGGADLWRWRDHTGNLCSLRT